MFPEEFTALLDAPGMEVWNQIAPVIAVTLWVWLTVLLWRGGFRDLSEQAARGGADRLQALAMTPVRAVMLSLAAAIGAGGTVFGLWVQGAVLLTVIEQFRAG